MNSAVSSTALSALAVFSFLATCCGRHLAIPPFGFPPTGCCWGNERRPLKERVRISLQNFIKDEGRTWWFCEVGKSYSRMTCIFNYSFGERNN
ncbi:hypothetical protein CDAR_242361 [Caerostris darwini]|uniref:Secreted protein n=1 Tax=Caerostris darwini TaxID=1538125 RepID=A0AAV4RSB5_9ARAC|nr:hypothetical protein CDAR_242361 [Caerostris darwini]